MEARVALAERAMNWIGAIHVAITPEPLIFTFVKLHPSHNYSVGDTI